MSWTEIPAGKLVAAQQRLWVEFGEDAQRIAERLINSPEFLAKMGMYARTESFVASSQQSRARQIMGKNMFGIDDAMKHFGINPSTPMLRDLTYVPFSEETLIACKDSHILVAVFPMQRSQPWEDIAMRFINFSEYGKKHTTQGVRNALGRSITARWLLIRKTPAEESLNVIYRNFQLPQNEKFVEAADLIYAIIAHFFGSGERLFENTLVRTLNIETNVVMRICIGMFGKDGFLIHLAHNAEYAPSLGIATQVRPNH